MERFLKRKVPSSSGASDPRPNVTSSIPNVVDLNDLPSDPSDRPRILDYNPNQRDEIRRKYLLKGPCQPSVQDFPSTFITGKDRRFVKNWFNEFLWLEYSVKADKAYCLSCYLFRDCFGNQGGSDAFVTNGFNSWGKKKRLSIHVGNLNSFHNRAHKKCLDLMKPNQSIPVAFNRPNNIERNEYRIRVEASIEVCRFLLDNALPFRGHDESEKSLNKGLFLQTLKFLRKHNEPIRNVTLENAPGNNQMVSPTIQKDIVTCFAQEVLKSIFEEIGDDVFALLVDESSDVSKKEQMAVVLRYVDTIGLVKERFVGIVHVMNTSALSLKSAIDSLFTTHGLSLKQVRGQGYDGASNMCGEFNGLKALILKENESAHYVHCFAHQLQLVIVAVAKKHPGIEDFFDMLSIVMNVVCASCKRKDMLREIQKEKVREAIGNSDIETGKGLNQELTLVRAGDTRWSSHYKSILSLVALFPSVVEVLKYVQEEGESSNRLQANGILLYFESFDFVFYLHLMLHILGLTNSLSQALQRKDQDILEVISLVKATKRQLQKFRENGFDPLLEKEVSPFCEKCGITFLNMTENYVNSKNRRRMTNITNRHYYEFDIFNTVLDMQIQEFGDRFSEVGTDLLNNMVALNPRDSFSQFDASKLVNLSELYPYDFSVTERLNLMRELDIYYDIMKEDERFANLNGIADLARVMVETRKHISYPLVYRLLKLALVLPVATATVERCFSAMKLVKTDLRNRIGDEFLNSALICAIEKEALDNVKNEDVINRFQKMKPRREQP